MVMMDDRTSSEAASPVGGLNGENASFAQSEMQIQQQAETAPLLNAESLREVLGDVPGEHLALRKKREATTLVFVLYGCLLWRDSSTPSYLTTECHSLIPLPSV